MSNLRPLFTYELSHPYRLPGPDVLMNQRIRSSLTLPPLPTPHYWAPPPTMNRYEPYPPISSSSSFNRKKGEQSILSHPPPPPYTTKPLAPYPPIPQSHHITQSHSNPAHTHSHSQSGRYQPSRGAQRDAKYTKKEADKAEFLAQAKLQARTTKNHHHPTEGASNPVQSKSYRRHRPPSVPVPVPLINHEQQLAIENTERIRREQLIAIQAVRQEHLESQRRQADKEEQDKKIRRIQLQVFVHARPTPCGWKGCQALLNSWATLEKHIHHSHLHPAFSSASRVRCEWQGCNGVFWTRDECETHVLVEHMGAFSARCPFDCLFEGPSFPSLMAHISRRHPNATPDDFIPGLIHEKPILPPLSALPHLPSMNEPFKYHPFNPIQPFSGGVGNRYKKMVQRKCFKGRYPRVEAFEDKKGAGAAIRAIIENSKRLREIPPESAISVKIEGEGDGEVQEEPEPGTAKTVVELIDVLGSAKWASEEAKREYGDGDGGDYSTTSSSRSSRSSPIESESRSVSGTSSHDSSEYKAGKRDGLALKEVKRSQRLMLKIGRRDSDSSYGDSPQKTSLYSEEC